MNGANGQHAHKHVEEDCLFLRDSAIIQSPKMEAHIVHQDVVKTELSNQIESIDCVRWILVLGFKMIIFIFNLIRCALDSPGQPCSRMLKMQKDRVH